MIARISRCILFSVALLLAGPSGAGGETLQDVFHAGQKKFDQSDFKGAKAIFERGLTQARQEKNRRAEGVFLTILGLVYEAQDDYPQARRHYEQALAIARELKDRKTEERVLYYLGRVNHARTGEGAGSSRAGGETWLDVFDAGVKKLVVSLNGCDRPPQNRGILVR